MALIRYIGKQPRKVDDVRKTARVWEHQGAILEVGDDEAYSYIAHPRVWERVTQDMLEASRLDAEHQALKVIGECLTKLSADGLDKTAQMVTDAYDKLSKKVSAPAAKSTESGLALIDADGNPSSAQSEADKQAEVIAAQQQTERAAKIKTAVDALEKGNPEHFTAQGKPRVAAVEETSGLAGVTAKEIAQALA